MAIGRRSDARGLIRICLRGTVIFAGKGNGRSKDLAELDVKAGVNPRYHIYLSAERVMSAPDSLARAAL